MNNLCFYCNSSLEDGRCNCFPNFCRPVGQRVFSCELFSPKSLKMCDVVYRDFKSGFYIGTVNPKTFNGIRNKNQLNYVKDLS